MLTRLTVLCILTAAMTSLTRTMTDKLLQDYNSVLLHISFKLDEDNRKNLLHYCNGLILKQVTDSIDILRSLEYNGKISWEDVNLVKEAMSKINRFDIVKEVTEYEYKRDLTLLLDYYARKILNLDLHCCSVSVKRMVGRLVRLVELARDKVDSFSSIILTVESSRDIRKALVDFEDDIDCREQPFSWNEFTVLVVIAGEIIAVAYKNEELQESAVIDLCSTAADELCSRMTELGSWVS